MEGSLMKTLKFYYYLLKTNIKASTSLRGAFLMQSIFMVFNNLIFFTVWWILMAKYQNMGSWNIVHIELMFAMCAAGFGIAVVFAGGLRDMSRMIIDGDLDSYLVQPKNVLFSILGSYSRPSGWGDILSGVVLLGFAGFLTSAYLPAIVVLMICAGIIFVATAVIFNSLVFWLGHMEGFEKVLFEFVLTLSTYPQTVFSGALKFALFTILPAGFISYLPVEFITGKRWDYFFIVIGATIFYAWLAKFVFERGLKRYESGNRFGVRA
jgi:ABC-2 type transport system permease protein